MVYVFYARAKMEKLLGTSQYRLNYATDYAEAINENMKRLELIWKLAKEGALTKEQATNGIKNHIELINKNIEYFKTHYSWREDME